MKMKTSVKIVAVSALLLAGCETGPSNHQDPFFPSDGKPTSVELVISRTVAAGAAQEATLGAHHFDGPELNSLGAKKLASMVEGRKLHEPMTVYLDLRGEESQLAPARTAAVNTELKHLSVPSDHIVVKMGRNPAVTGSAAATAKGLKAIEPETKDAAGGEGEAGAAEASAGQK
jgi:hypothetical protein